MRPLRYRLMDSFLAAAIMRLVQPQTTTEAMAKLDGETAVAMRCADAILTSLANFLGDDIVEAMCRAHDREEAAQKGEPDLWAIRDRGEWDGDDGDWEVFRQERLAAMRAALKDVGLSA